MDGSPMPTDIMIPAWVNGTLTPVEKLAAHRLWANTCCTHPEWDEAPDLCATRRLNEELGITGLTPVYKGEVEYRADVGGGLIEHEVVQVYLATAPAKFDFTPNPDEVMATRWVNKDTLNAEVAKTPDHFTPWLRIYLANHADLIFGPA